MKDIKNPRVAFVIITLISLCGYMYGLETTAIYLWYMVGGFVLYRLITV